MYSLLQLFLTAFQLRLLLWLVVLVTTVGWGCCAAGALDGSIPETATAREEVELGGGVVYHPNAPPPSRDPIPPNSTQLSLLFDEGVWVVVVENDISDLEVNCDDGSGSHGRFLWTTRDESWCWHRWRSPGQTSYSLHALLIVGPYYI